MRTEPETICIIGAGQAGCELALGLRQNGWSGSIVLIGEESHAPYQRPALSKAYLKGAVDRGALFLRQPAVYERANVQLLLNTRVEHVDRRSKTLGLASGMELRYARLALATGGRPRRLSLPETPHEQLPANVHYLRSIDDVERLRAGFHPGRRLVVIGGGYIGLEVAASAVACGLRVTVLEAAPRVLARVTAPEMSSFYEHVHRERGVDLRTGVKVRGLHNGAARNASAIVHCSDGTELPADIIVVGVGLEPNTELAQAAGLAIDNGVVVDECARTSDPQIVAAGDCTNHPNKLCGRPVRLESVQNAIEQARVAAATLIGNPRAYDALPWFWSDQYDVKLQIAGLSYGYERIVLRGSMHERSFAMFYLKDGRVLACDAVNRPREFLAAKRLISARNPVAAEALADESMALSSLAPGV